MQLIILFVLLRVELKNSLWLRTLEAILFEVFVYFAAN